MDPAVYQQRPSMAVSLRRLRPSGGLEPRRALAYALMLVLVLTQKLHAIEWSEIMPMARKAALMDVTLAGDRVVAVGERGHVLISDDYGKTWTQVSVPTRSTLTAVWFSDARDGWAVGHDFTFLHTRDGGASWQTQHAPGNPEHVFLDVRFLNGTHGLAVGAYGVAFQTRDAGRSWSPFHVSEEELHLNRVSASPEGALFLACEGGMLLVSRDDGETWVEMDSPYPGSFFGLLPLGARILLAYGLRGNVFRTTDAGTTWTQIRTGPRVLLSHAIRLASGMIVIAGQGGNFLLSRDGGRSFSTWAVPQVPRPSAMVETPDGAVIVTALNGVHRLLPPTPGP